MPEGHAVHRVAEQLDALFRGRSNQLDSPQGRFAGPAQTLSGKRLNSVEAFGKQLFLGYDSDLWIRIHLGIYGKWRFFELDRSGNLPSPEGQIRLRIWNSLALAELRGPTACELISGDERLAILSRIGPDPLRPDAEKIEFARFLKKTLSSTVEIGRLLMDQSVISGIGNVYRAELLFRARLSPFKSGKRLKEPDLHAIWQDAVRLLGEGKRTGVMVTRDELLGQWVPAEERNFVYKRSGEACRVCGKPIRMRIVASRKLYWCPNCQR